MNEKMGNGIFDTQHRSQGGQRLMARINRNLQGFGNLEGFALTFIGIIVRAITIWP